MNSQQPANPDQLSAVERWRAALEADDVTHLDYEQLTAHVNRTTNAVEGEIIASHLAVCPACEAELRALEDARDELRPFPVRPPELSLSWREKFTAWWEAPHWLMSAGAVAALALIAILATSVWRLNRDKHELQAELAQARDNYARLRQEQDETEKTLAALRAAPAQHSSDTLLTLHDTNGNVTLDQEGNVNGLGELTAAQQQMLKAALGSGLTPASALAGKLRGKLDVLLGKPSAGVAFALVSPVGKVVESTRPVLRWKPLEGATGYVVSVFDENLNKIASSESLIATSWTVPQALQRGKVFTWQVKARKGELDIVSPAPPAPEARFAVIEQARFDEIQQAKSRQSHLLLGLLYAQAGLKEEAERELRLLVRQNPDAEIARKLLQAVRK